MATSHTTYVKGSPIHERAVYGDTTKTKQKAHVLDVSDPNQLFEFASYSVLFTLSALNQDDLMDRDSFLNGPPHDIIIRSAGIGPDANETVNGMSSSNKETLYGAHPSDQGNIRMAKTLDKARKEFQKNKDLYFRSVIMKSIPGLNEKRRLTSVTNITMQIEEPAGISLIQRIRAAAANNDYLDHIDAPYLLTIDFKGWDEHSRPIKSKNQKTLKRVIPIKFITIDLQVNSSGTTYNVQAIPYNESGFLNHYNYLRTSGTLTGGKTKTFGNVVQEFEDILNDQNLDEQDGYKLSEIRDKYKIVIDPFFDPEGQKINVDTLGKMSMVEQGATPAQHLYDKPTQAHIKPGITISRILEQLMKTLPRYNYDDPANDPLKRWKTKVTRELSQAQHRGGKQEVWEKSQGADFYYIYFMIKSSVVPISGDFDKVRATHPKLITYEVVPYKIHAYSLAIPGVSTGDKFKSFVYKTYNYIFTGQNVDILDLDINYKIAYFQARLKNVDINTIRQNQRITTPTVKRTGSTTAKDIFGDQNFLLKSEVGSHSQSTTGSETKNTPLDQFLDALTHPMADMVNVTLEINGDPAWLGQSQFIPIVVTKTDQGWKDKKMNVFHGNYLNIWNEEYRCYNSDVAEPIIMLNFRMPTDLNDRLGTYELASQESANFSGLYRVVEVENSFDDGKFTQTLRLVRFNNQGVIISSPTPIGAIKDKDGITTAIANYEQLQELGEFNFGRAVNKTIKNLIGRFWKQ